MNNFGLETFGKLSLKGSDFKEPLALLLLAYLISEGESPRRYLTELLWPESVTDKRNRSMAELVYRLKKHDKTLLKQENNFLSTNLNADFKIFEASSTEAALDLYKGAFLAQIEFNKRLHLGEELSEWLINKREYLSFKALGLRLKKAEATAFDGKFIEAAQLAWESYLESKQIAYPDKSIYERLHKLMLAGSDSHLLGVLEREARELYGDLNFISQGYKARALLSHSLLETQGDLLGREQDLRYLNEHLVNQRLLSLHGPGGIGKTSLARALAQDARGKSYSRDGLAIAYFEQLNPAATELEILSHIATSLSLSGDYAKLETLIAFFENKDFLLVLDNLEHLLAQIKAVIKELLASCPGLRIVVSSREVLSLDGEHVFSLAPLGYPGKSGTLSWENRQIYPALMLFEQEASRKGALLKESDLELLREIADLLGGNPLAIKLCAAWTNSLSLKQILRQLEQGLELLSLGPNKRHESMEVVFGASLKLLAKDELKSLIALAVFDGGFNFEAALEVTGEGPVALRKLLEKALLRFDPERGRYSFHPLLERYIKTRFNEANLKLGENHKAYYFAALDKLMDQEGKEQSEPLNDLLQDLANLEKAWNYASINGEKALLFKSVRSLVYFVRSTGRFRLGEKLLASSLAHFKEISPATTALCANLATLKYHLGDYKEAVKLAKEALEMLAQVEIEAERQVSIHRLILGTLEASYSSLAEFEKCLEVAYSHIKLLEEKAPGSFAYAYALANLAITERELLGKAGLDKLFEAQRVFEQSSKASLPWLKTGLANAYILLGDYAHAKEELDLALGLAESLGQDYWAAYARYSTAKLDYLLGDYSNARTTCETLLENTSLLRPSLVASIYQLLANSIEDKHAALAYFDKAQTQAEKLGNLVSVNSIKVDRLAYLIKHKLDGADALGKDLEEQVEKMYFEDKQKFLTLLSEDG